MKITVYSADEKLRTQQFIPLDVDPHESVEILKAILEAETGVPLQHQQLVFNGNELDNSSKLSSCNVKDGELLEMKVTATASSSRVANNDSNLNQQESNLQRKQEEQEALLNANSFDVEAQRKIEQIILQRVIDENLETAFEHYPEAFARVVMLYVNMEINGLPLKALVDSGADSTIISKNCAERCGLLHLLDQQYKGVTHGVGPAEILGQIHLTNIKIGDVHYTCSFLELDLPDKDFLFGLDILRQNQCVIDLKANVLRVGGGEVSVPFLQEKDIPPQYSLDRKASKTAVVLDTSGAIEVNDELRTRGQSAGYVYVNVEVNGLPLKAFVDSGAQLTTISKSCAERCGLLKLLDQRSKVVAHGVGEAKFLGRIHIAQIKIGDVHYACSIMVLESLNIDFLLGLDMLRQHECVIDLKENVLRIGGGELPFLQGTSQGDITQAPGFETKVAKLIELGFSRDAAVQALRLSKGNEEQAAGYLFGG